MPYAITRLVLTLSGSVDISAERYASIQRANAFLATGLALEEELDFVLGNFVEYEQELLSIALNEMVFLKIDWSAFRSDAHVINRRILNLLSAGRLYSHQVRHHFATMYGRHSSQLRDLKNQIAAASTLDSVRFVNALRNYVQYRGLPVQILSYPSSWEPKGKYERLRFSVSPAVDVTTVASDPQLGPLLRTPPSNKGRVPLTPLLRQYVESLWSLHEYVRTAIDPDLQESETTINAGIEQARTILGDPLVDLAAVETDGDGHVMNPEHLTDNLSSQRRMLIQRNRSLGKLSRRYVSSQGDE